MNRNAYRLYERIYPVNPINNCGIHVLYENAQHVILFLTTTNIAQHSHYMARTTQICGQANWHHVGPIHKWNHGKRYVLLESISVEFYSVHDERSTTPQECAIQFCSGRWVYRRFLITSLRRCWAPRDSYGGHVCTLGASVIPSTYMSPDQTFQWFVEEIAHKCINIQAHVVYIVDGEWVADECTYTIWIQLHDSGTGGNVMTWMPN